VGSQTKFPVPEIIDLDVSDLAGEKTSSPASQLARIRWSKPENVERRIESLADHIKRTVDALPPLTEDQRARLAALLRPGTEAEAA
jgi:hypothetical protein